MLIESSKKYYDELESERFRLKKLPEDNAERLEKLPIVLQAMSKLRKIDQEPELDPIPRIVLEISHLARYSKLDNKSKKAELAKLIDQFEKLVREDERSKYI